MDVIALHQAGFAGAVAPLGTALTAEQLEALWRLAPEPVLCFDGDAAGGRAAQRAMETALPLLAPDRSLRIATLPAGEDPDSLVRGGGRAAFEAVLRSPRALDEALYAALCEGGGGGDAGGPRRAARPAGSRRGADRRPGARRRVSPCPARPLLRRPRPARQARRGGGTGLAPGAASPEAERQRCLAAILLRHPVLLRDVEEACGQLDLPAGLPRGCGAPFSTGSTPPICLTRTTLLAHLRSFWSRRTMWRRCFRPRRCRCPAAPQPTRCRPRPRQDGGSSSD